MTGRPGHPDDPWRASHDGTPDGANIRGGRGDDVRERPDDVRERPGDVPEAPDGVREGPITENPIGVTRTSLTGASRTSRPAPTGASGTSGSEAIGASGTSDLRGYTSLQCECWYRLLLIDNETRKLRPINKPDNEAGAWWCPACNKVRRNELLTQIEASDIQELFFANFESKSHYQSARKQRSRTNANMVSVFFKNGTVFVVSDMDLTPTNNAMRPLPSEQVMFNLDNLLAKNVPTTVDHSQGRKLRIALLKQGCTIKQVRTFGKWSTRDKQDEKEKRFSLVAKYHNAVKLNKALLELGKTMQEEFDEDDCAELASLLRLADSEDNGRA